MSYYPVDRTGQEDTINGRTARVVAFAYGTSSLCKPCALGPSHSGLCVGHDAAINDPVRDHPFHCGNMARHDMYRTRAVFVDDIPRFALKGLLA